MNYRYVEEPSLLFGRNQHICPKAGIADYNPYDINNVRPEKIITGIIGKSESIDKVCAWLKSAEKEVAAKPAKKGKRQNLRLFPGFPGFNKQTAFLCELAYDDSYLRSINNSDFDNIISSHEGLQERIAAVADLYLNELKYLSKNKTPNVILCVLSEDFMEFITKAVLEEKYQDDDDGESVNLYADKNEEEDEVVELEQNFRRYLKAKAMQYGVPIQIVRDRIANPNSEMQDPATIAWNFFTAIYYKAGGVPWALVRKDMAETTCYAGISFFKSRDKKLMQTSIAQ
ncbi:MAG TPA: hypothetical protein VF421_12715, partial [Niabella sp.]